MTKEKLTKKILIGGFILLVLLFSSLGTLTIFLTIKRFNNSSQPGQVRKVNEYQSLVLNPLTNDTSFGIVSKYVTLNGDGFISYTDSDENLVLVSNFGSEEYKCTGSCYCDDRFSQRKHLIVGSTVLKKGLLYLVAATSTLLAIKFATEKFQEECSSSHILEDCPLDSVRSEVDVCENVMMMSSKYTAKEGELGLSDFDQRLDFDDPTTTRFLCKGSCVVKDADLRKESSPSQSNPCTDLKKNAIVDIYQTGTNGPEETAYLDYETAREKFRELFLRGFCNRKLSLSKVYTKEDGFNRMKKDLGMQIQEEGDYGRKKKKNFWDEFWGEEDEQENENNDDNFYHHEEKRQKQRGNYFSDGNAGGHLQCYEGTGMTNQNVQCRKIRHSDRF